jgi:hypothetical protein
MADSPICARLAPELVDAIDAAAAVQNVTRAEMIKAVLEGYFFGTDQTLVGADAGYVQARRMATQIAHAMLRRAAREMPDDVDSAMMMVRDERMHG